MKKVLFMAILSIFLLMPFVPVSSQTTIKVVATTSIIADVVSNIGGSFVEIETLIPNGVDPHDYQATADASTKLDAADIIFFSGEGVEEGLESTLEVFETEGIAHSLLESIPETLLIESEDHEHAVRLLQEEHAIDPHFWHDLTLMTYAVDMIRDELIEIDPTNSADYTQNAEDYNKLLIDTSDEIVSRIDVLNDTKQLFLVTQHNAFQYWGKKYTVTTHSLEGISTSDETGVNEIEEMAQYLKDNEIEVIFSEKTVPADQLEAVIDATVALGWEVVIGGELYSGSLPDDGDYISMIKTNSETILDAIENPPAFTQGVDNKILPYFLLFPVFALYQKRIKK